MTDALVEAVRSVMTSYLLENVSPDTVRVALQAIKAAGYRVVPVEETEGMPRASRCRKIPRGLSEFTPVYPPPTAPWWERLYPRLPKL